MFIGRHEAAVDSKGRIHLPAKVRDALEKFGGQLVLTISDRCLAGYPKNMWLEKYEALEKEAHTPERGDLLRAITENAVELEQKNGRILIPAWLRQYADIEKDVVIVGRIKKIEIWSAARHARVAEGYEPEKLSGMLRNLGF
ncbi:MAG: division/cell wall cluster transcriptional repressor MraZ [Nitrospinota bacterium]|nr:division/cell wall cluster transcriptional repressor MraZ [Nitrospinota bacterium]MDH5756863.1 division/cell wall cluster transcriptional repressor MraZ [Nitrospinota bacterium]